MGRWLVMDDRYERGYQKMLEVAGPKVAERLNKLRNISPIFAKTIVEHGFGEIISRPHLAIRDREFATLGALAVLGEENEIATHTGNALRAGISWTELEELALHLTLYAGYPRAINFLSIAHKAYMAYEEEKKKVPSPDSEQASR